MNWKRCKNYNFNFPETKVVPNPKHAINANDHLKLNACAIKPIVGGPIKNPKNPILDTDAMATLGDNFFDLPANP